LTYELKHFFSLFQLNIQ